MPSAATAAFAFFAGIFCIVAAWRNWDWFFDNWRARPFVAMLGREGARSFYVILGGVLMGLAFVL